MKSLTLTLITLIFCMPVAMASEYSERLNAQRNQADLSLDQKIAQIQASSQARVRKMMYSFARRHGGFSEGPEDTTRYSDFMPIANYTFSTRDGLACAIWDKCAGNGGPAISCIDSQLRTRNFGPKLCSIK